MARTALNTADDAPPPEAAGPQGALRQVAAAPLRQGEDGEVQILLITSRETRRWVIPKGWPMRRKSDPAAAATEARQEAGVVGVIDPEPLGMFAYFKRREEHFDLVDVTVYRLDVTGQKKSWREQAQREQRWCSLEEASDLVQEPGLQAMLLDLAVKLRA